ncbi:hypothetical protein [Azospirillum argentinense]
MHLETSAFSPSPPRGEGWGEGVAHAPYAPPRATPSPSPLPRGERANARRRGCP